MFVVQDFLQAEHRHAGNADPIAECLPLRVAEAGRFVLNERVKDIDVLCAVCEHPESRIADELCTTGEAEEVGPVAVGVGQDAHVAIAGVKRFAVLAEHSFEADLSQWGFEGRAVQVFDQGELRGGFHHRHFHGLAAAAPGLLQQGCHDGVGDSLPGDLVAQDRGSKGRFAVNHRVKSSEARSGLDHIIVGGAPCVGPG